MEAGVIWPGSFTAERGFEDVLVLVVGAKLRLGTRMILFLMIGGGLVELLLKFMIIVRKRRSKIVLEI